MSTSRLRYFIPAIAASVLASFAAAAPGAPAAIQPPKGPFTCTEVIGLMTTGEWYNAGFEEGLGAGLGDKWQGRFAHYGYVMEYAKPDSYAWSPVALTGVNSVTLTEPCATGGAAPDRSSTRPGAGSSPPKKTGSRTSKPR